MLGDVQAFPIPPRPPEPSPAARPYDGSFMRTAAAPPARGEKAMQNDVYRITRHELTELVSPRAAERMLDDALRASGQSPETIGAAAMRKLLLGPVRRQLATVLPKQGLTRSLKRIAADVAKVAKTGSAPTQAPSFANGAGGARAEAARGAAEAHLIDASGGMSALDAAVKRSSVYLPDLPSLRLTPAPAARLTGTAGVAAAGVAPDAAPTAAKAGAALSAATAPAASHPSPPAPAAVLDAAAMDAAVRIFGALETVRQVVIVRGTRVALERGEAVDARRLPTLVRSTRLLLARGGNLRVLSLEHPQGVLFVFPMGADAIVVVTRPNVNIGAVLAARAAFEEAA